LDVCVGVVLGYAANLGRLLDQDSCRRTLKANYIPCSVQRLSLLQRPACRGMIARERESSRVS
jgi:hypothetical protein